MVPTMLCSLLPDEEAGKSDLPPFCWLKEADWEKKEIGILVKIPTPLENLFVWLDYVVEFALSVLADDFYMMDGILIWRLSRLMQRYCLVFAIQRFC